MNWKNEFLEKAFPLKKSFMSLDEAMSLKNRNIPPFLYKYRQIDEYSIKNLEDDTVWLAEPESFNDPYDCSHTVDFETLQKRWGGEILKSFLANSGLDISAEVKNKMYEENDPIQAFLEYSSSKVNAPLKLLLKSACDEIYRRNTKSMSNFGAKSFKLCSFSEDKESILMWSHYANFHKGFCIEYDISALDASNHSRKFLYPSVYSKGMFDATECVSMGASHNEFNKFYLLRSALFKAIEWEYEKEWRLIFPFGIYNSACSYKFCKPKAVYLGAKIEDKDQLQIEEICLRKEIPVYKMETNHRTYALEPHILKKFGGFL